MNESTATKERTDTDSRTNGHLTGVLQFIEQLFDTDSADPAKDMLEIHSAVAEKYPSEKRQYNQLFIVRIMRRTLCIENKTRLVGHLYLALVLALKNKHRGDVSEDDIYYWAQDANRKCGFRGATPKKISDALVELNEREDLGWKGRIKFVESRDYVPKPTNRTSVQLEIKPAAKKSKTLKETITEILIEERFTGWEIRCSPTDMIAELAKKGWPEANYKSVSNCIGKLRKDAEKEQTE